MSEKSELWAAVVVSYDNDSLVSLTNINDPAATTIDTTAGEDAAQEVIDFWDFWAQLDYDSTDTKHVSVGKRGVIAVLWHRGGSALEVAKIEWEEVFGTDGYISKIKRTGPRSRVVPKSNSGTTQAAETSNGVRVRPWSSREALPNGLLISRTLANNSGDAANSV